MEKKPVVWEGDSKEVASGFPDDIKTDLGNGLWQVQIGESPSDFGPLHGVGPGVYELRAHDSDTYRVVYIAKFEEAIYVLHAFKKKSHKGIATPEREIKLAAMRLKAVVARRKEATRRG